MNTTHTFVFSGFGGQGVMFAGQLLAYAAMDEGLEVTWIPSYGPEMRGGTAHCFVVVSDKAIGSPIVSRPAAAVAFNHPSFEKYAPIVAPGGVVVANSSMIQSDYMRDDIDILHIPATTLAEEVGTTRLTNMVLLGAMLQMQSVLSIDSLKQALDGHIPAHRRNLLEQNFLAVDRGAAFVEAELKTL